jgi:hypothetical protein
MMTSAEAQDWQRRRAVGQRRYVLRATFIGTLPFLVIGLIVVRLFRNQDPKFVILVAAAAVVISLAGELLFSSALWLIQERRYRKRTEAEDRGELPRTVGV